jgi:hypothetical protein
MQRSCGLAQGLGALDECFIGFAIVNDIDANTITPANTILFSEVLRIDFQLRANLARMFHKAATSDKRSELRRGSTPTKRR